MPASLNHESTCRRRLSRRLHRQLRRLTLWPLTVIGVLCLVLIGLIAYLFHSAQRVDHTNEVLAKISRVGKLAVDLESGVRGYRITGDAVFLEPFERASAALPAELDALGSLVRDDPSQLTELQNLRDALRAWNESAANMRERTTTKLPIDVPLQLSGKTLMDAVRARLDVMEADEHALLSERSRDLARVRMFIMPAVLLAGLIFAPLLIISIRRTLAHLDAGYRAAWDETDRERERLDVTLSSIGDAVISADTAGTVTYLNPVAVALTGWSAEEACSKPVETVFNIINETTRETVESPVTKALRAGTIVGLANHTLLLARDGREIPIADSVAPIRDHAGLITGVVMVFRDQTKVREAEQEVTEKTRLLDLTTDAILVRDVEGRIVYWNDGAEKLYGWSREEALGKRSHDLLKTECPKPFEEITEELYRTNHWMGEFVHTTRDGRRITVLARKVLDRDSRGNPDAVLQTLTDITGRKLQEEALSRLAAIVESSNDAIVSMDLNGIITSWNASAERMFGYTAQEAVRQPVTLLIPLDHADEERRILARIRDGERTAQFETVRRRKDGTLFDVSLTVSPIMDAQGRVVGASKIVRDITERKRAEDELLRSEALYRAIGESIKYGIWICDADGRNTYASKSFLKLIGMTQEQCADLGWGEVLHPDDAAGAIAAWQECVRTGAMWDKEHRFRGVDGQWHPVLARGMAVEDESGQIICWAGINLDISQLKKAEAAVRESEERFRTMANSISQLAWTARPDGHIFWYNQRWYDYTGATPEEMEGWGWQNVLDAAVLPEVLESWKASIATGDVFEMTFPLRGADGVFRPFLTRAIPLKNEAGQVTQWFGTNTDVDELKRADEAVRAAGERFRFMAEAMPQKICTTKPDGALEYLNARWHEYLGPAMEKLQKLGWQAVIHPDDVEETLKRWRACLDNGQNLELEHRVRDHEGKYRWHLTRSQPLRDGEGKITMWISTNTDIDDMMQAQEELIEAEQQLADRAVQLEALVAERTVKLSSANAQLLVAAEERKRLEAEIAYAVEYERARLGQELHDGLVQEMVGVGMLLHVLERQMKKPAPEFATEAGRLGMMIEKAQENARDLAKNFYPVELEQYGLHVALKGLAQRAQAQHGIRCTLETDEHSTTKLSGASAVQLFRIAQEAVQNAAKHSKASHIVISLHQENGAWLLTVKDDGIGLPANAQPTKGMGQRILQYRARIIQGTLTVRNNPDRGGVLVSCAVPAMVNDVEQIFGKNRDRFSDS